MLESDRQRHELHFSVAQIELLTFINAQERAQERAQEGTQREIGFKIESYKER